MKSGSFRINIIFILFLLFIFNSFAQTESVVKHPEWSYNSTIYEVNIRQYTEEGTFEAFEDHLPRLKELGVKILWLMPIHPVGEKNRKGTLGSYYAVKDYKDVNPEFGSFEDFKHLVDKIHDMDMYVIIDWVANHTSWDNVWVSEHPDFYTKDSLGNFTPPVADWSDVIDLNYDNMEMQAAMLDAMKFWVDEYNIDGYRCDVAGMVPVDFWIKVRTELDEIKPVFMLAEAWEPELHKAFDMTYDWDMHHLMNDIAQGKKNVNDLKTRLEKEKEIYPKSGFLMQFTSNHDENSWNGTVKERLGDAAETFAALTFVIPGMPLIYSGQEAGLDKRLQFFEKDPIVWKESKFTDLYSTLIDLKKNNKALWNGEEEGNYQTVSISSSNENNSSVFAIEREKDGDKILAIFNLSKETLNQIKFDADDDYKDIFTNESVNETLELKPWEFKIYSVD